MQKHSLVWMTVMGCLCALLAGCAASPLDPGTLAYFRELEGQRFWAKTGASLTLQAVEGPDLTLGADQQDEYMITFAEIQVVEENRRGETIAANVAVYSGSPSQPSSTLCRVSATNAFRLKSFLGSAETDQARERRLADAKRAEEEKQRVLGEMARIKKRLRFDYDKFQDVTFVEHSIDSREKQDRRPYLLPYIGYNAGHKWYFVRAQLRASSWYFVNKAIALIGDQDRYVTPEYPSYDDNVTHESTYGGIYERIDFMGTNERVDAMAHAVAAAPAGTRIAVRLIGEYAMDGELTREEHQAWKDIMFYYDHFDPSGQ